MTETCQSDVILSYAMTQILTHFHDVIFLKICPVNRPAHIHDVTDSVYNTLTSISTETATFFLEIQCTTLQARCPGKCSVTSFFVTSSRWGQSLHSQKNCISWQCNSFSFDPRLFCDFNAIIQQCVLMDQKAFCVHSFFE